MKKIISIVFLFIGIWAYSQTPTPFRSGIVSQLASDPVTTTEGWLYYNTTENVYKYYNGTEWVDVGADNSNFVTLDGTNIYTGINSFTNGLSVLNGITISSGGLSIGGNVNASSSVANFLGVRVDLDPYSVSWATDDSVPTKQDIYTKIESLNNFDGDYNSLSNLPSIPSNSDYVDLTTGQSIFGNKIFQNTSTFQDGLLFKQNLVFQDSGNERTLNFGTGITNYTLSLPNKPFGTYTIATLSDISGGSSSDLQDVIDTGNLYTNGTADWVWATNNLTIDDSDEGFSVTYGVDGVIFAEDGFTNESLYSSIQATGFRLGNGSNVATFNVSGISANVGLNLPATSGTLALTSDIPSNEISTVIVTDSTYTFLEADLLDSKPHIFTNAIADTIEVTIPDVTKADSNLILASLRATNDIPIKIIPSDSANQYQYVIKNNDESVNIASYIENEWFSWRNLTSSVFTAPASCCGINLNGTFDNSSNLTVPSTWTVTGGVANYNGSGEDHFVFTLSENIVSGDEIEISLDVSNSSGASRFRFQYGGGSGETLVPTAIRGDGTYTFTHTLTTTEGNADLISIRGSNSGGGGSFTIDNVSVVKLN